MSSFFERASDDLIGNGLYGPAVGVIDVSLEQDASVKQLARVSPAEPEEPFDLLALCSSVSRTTYFLFMARIPVGLVPTRVHARILLLNQSVIED